MMVSEAVGVTRAVQIRLLRPEDSQAWDDFVQSHPLGSPFHLTAWKNTIVEVFGYRPMYLVAAEGNSIRGVLPLFLVGNWLMGRALISSPFAVYGGALTQGVEACNALRTAVIDLGRALRVGYIELRNQYAAQSLGFTPVSRHIVYIGQVGPDEEQLLQSIPRKTRRIVRRTLAEPFSTRVEAREYGAFEDLYARNLRRLGTPQFPKRYFSSLLKHFAGHSDIRYVELDGRLVAAVLTLNFRDRVLPYYGASDPDYNAHAPSTFMYYDQMRWAGKNGFRTYDFGRSKIESGSGHFKSHWGFGELPLHYEIRLIRRKKIPDYTPANPKYAGLIQIWKKLPLPVTRLLGPFLIRLVP